MQYNREVETMLSEGRHEDARTFTRSLIEATPDATEGWLHRADIEADAGDPALALQYAREARLRFPKETIPYLQEVIALWELGKHREAIRLRKKFEDEFPKDDLGIVTVHLIESTRRRRAYAPLRHFVRIGQFYDALGGLSGAVADIRHHSGDVITAHHLLIAAYRHDPYNPRICADLAESYVLCMKLSNSREMAEHVKELNPGMFARMTRVGWLSWVSYWPTCFNLGFVVLIATELMARTHWLGGILILALFGIILVAPTLIFFAILDVLGLPSIVWLSYVLMGIWAVLYAAIYIRPLGRLLDRLVVTPSADR